MTNPATALGGVARGSWPGARWRFRALALCAFAAAMLVVCAQAAAQVVASYSMSFVPSTIAPGGTSKLVLTVD